MILRTYKTKISVNNKQQTLLLQHIGCAMWAYNWALSKKKESFNKKEKIPNAIELHRELNKLKKTDCPWFYESSKFSPQNSLRDCDRAFQNFFTRCKKKVKSKKGFPKFKSKKNDKQSFRLDGAISVESEYIKLPRIGKLKLAEKDYIPIDCKILSATVSKRAGKWFISVQVETPDRERSDTKNDVAGIDLGIKNLATCSDGTTYKNPKALKKKKIMFSVIDVTGKNVIMERRWFSSIENPPQIYYMCEMTGELIKADPEIEIVIDIKIQNDD
jgi:putative transposase